jgi:HEAT repeats
MLPNALFVLSAFLTAPSAAMPSMGAPVLQDPAPVPDKRPEIAALCDKFKGHIEKKGSEDREATAVMDSMIQEWSKSGPKDKASMVTSISKSFDLRRVDESGKEGVVNDQLYRSAAVALGTMGPESTKAIVAAIDNKNLKKLTATRHQLILSLGKTKDKNAIDPLIQLLQDKDSTLIGAAGEALGEFGGHDLETRKKVFEGLLKVLMNAKDNKDANINDNAAREKYDVVGPPIITSLGKLSKHDERDPDKWQTWWNKNKLKNWDDTK